MTRRQEIVKKKAPVQVTGGGGFRYENSAAARFLLNLLGGTNGLGVDFGQITRIDWQARDSGWLTDDLVITRTHSGGTRTAAPAASRIIVAKETSISSSLAAFNTMSLTPRRPAAS
jgi:hypothetical protein